jgi:ATP-dependent DNA helicase DinG
MKQEGVAARPQTILPSVSEFFAATGILAHASGLRFEFRPGQLQMALFVEKALIQGSHLVVEAGTGTGKTLAYIYPSLRFSLITGRRIILSTGTKSLQEQLFYKDVPFLESILGPLNICYMKGRSNYLCRQKLQDIHQSSLSGVEVLHFKLIEEWAKTTETGDRAEITALPEKSTLWGRIDARTDACVGKECPHILDCCVSEMRRRAADSNLVIINHHLFFTDLEIKMKAPEASVLPAACAVVFDEAHELEHIASDCFGVAVSNRRVEDLIWDVRKGTSDAARRVEVFKVAGTVADRFALLWDCLPGKKEPARIVFDGRPEFVVARNEIYSGVLTSLQLLHSILKAVAEDDEAVTALVQRTSQLFSELRYLMESTADSAVFWIERRLAGHGNALNTFIQATPINVSEILSASVFETYDTTVLTSATLAVQKGFSHVRRALGIAEADEVIVPSLFDYPKQALLYVPKDIPDPRDDGFFDSARTQIMEVLRICEGRAFCLFTSYEMMQKMYEALKDDLPYPLLLHGAMTRGELLYQFRTTPHAVLFGTSSFWQGIDVQGEQLSCVIIDRLPFAVPSDPVLQARVKAIEKSGGSGFFDYQVPKAAIALKQGFGRLIRSTTDHGVLVMLDRRIQHIGYGKIFLESLPPYRITNDLDDVRRFMGVADSVVIPEHQCAAAPEMTA